MGDTHTLRNLLLLLAGLVVAATVAWWLIKALLALLVYVIVGVLVVGAGLYLYGRAKRSIADGGRRRIRR